MSCSGPSRPSDLRYTYPALSSSKFSLFPTPLPSPWWAARAHHAGLRGRSLFASLPLPLTFSLPRSLARSLLSSHLDGLLRLIVLAFVVGPKAESAFLKAEKMWYLQHRQKKQRRRQRQRRRRRQRQGEGGREGEKGRERGRETLNYFHCTCSQHSSYSHGPRDTGQEVKVVKSNLENTVMHERAE